MVFSRLSSKRLLFPSLVLSLGLYFDSQTQSKKSVHCCNLLGIISKKPNAETYLKQGLEVLQNKGYDSVGYSVYNAEAKDFELHKMASNEDYKIDSLTRIIDSLTKTQSFSGIAHTRWATVGSKTDQNSHPFQDFRQRLVLAHNGTITNFASLREHLLPLNINLTSETDSELIVQLLGWEMQQSECSLFEAAKKVIPTKLEGQWGIIIQDKENPNEFVVASQGSRLLVGLHDEMIIVSSDKASFQDLTSNYITLTDGEILQLSLENCRQFNRNQRLRIMNVNDSNELMVKPTSPYKYFFEQEIFSQGETTFQTLNYGSRLYGLAGCPKLGGLENIEAELMKSNHLVITAQGSSYRACKVVEHLFVRLRTFDKIDVLSSETIKKEDLTQDKSLLCVSQSGENQTIIDLLKIASSIPKFGLINVIGSQISQLVGSGVYLNCGKELAYPTKSFTSQIVGLILISLWVSYKRDASNKIKDKKQAQRLQIIQSMKAIPVAIGENLALIKNNCKQIALQYFQNFEFVLLGQGPCLEILQEGAFKLKHMCMCESLAVDSSNFKSEALMPNSVVFIIMLYDDYFQSSLEALNQITNDVIVITECKNKIPNKPNIKFVLDVPDCEDLTFIMSIMPLQKIVYEICLLKNIDPDQKNITLDGEE